MSIKLSDDNNKNEVSKSLLLKQRQIEEQIKSLDASDPVFLELSPEPSDMGEDAWKADTHAKMVVIKNGLQKFSSKIEHSLKKISTGTYGLCDKCGHSIEVERMQAIPTAALCVACATLASSL